MSYVSLTLARQHCNVTSDVSDELLQFYVNAAEQRAAAFLNRPLSELLDPVGPPEDPDAVDYADAVRHAILLYVADAVLQRETIVTGGSTTELRTAENILFPYRIHLGV